MNSFKQLLSQPKKVIPIFAIIVVAISAFLFMHIGQAPTIPSSILATNPTESIISGSNISLSFPKSGGIEAVQVKNGDEVHKGQVLARLSAPDALGAVRQAKGALDLAEAQFTSMNIDYRNTKAQQDLLVANAHQTLLSSSLEGSSSVQDTNIPIISGTYTCAQEGSYIIKPYISGDDDSGVSANYSGLEAGTIGIKYTNSVPLGTCGLQIKFVHNTNFNPFVVWTINIPNTKSSVYLANKNAYELAQNTRDKVLADFASKVAGDNSVAKAQVDAARGAYEAALGAYQNNVIVAPVDAKVTFVDQDLKIGQSVTAGKSVISLIIK